jgi:hypothetical protein
VKDYLEVEKWFLSRREADKYFEKVLNDRSQEKSMYLQIVVYSTTCTPSEILVRSLNGDGWADSIETVRRANPTVRI